MRQVVKVDNRVRVPLESVSDAQLAALRAEFEHENPDHEKWKRLKLRSKPPPTHVRTWEEIVSSRAEVWEINFPRGGLERVMKILRAGYAGRPFPWEVHYDTTCGTVCGKILHRAGIPEHNVELWPFQREMVDRAVEARVCCLRAPPAAGKTTAGLALAAHLDLPTLVVVWTGALLKQWVDRCVTELGVRSEWVGVINGDERRIGPITIGMQQTLANCAEEYSQHFGLVICDELQRFASDTFREVIDHFASAYRVGISADERRADGKEFLIYDHFGDVAFEVGREELEASGRIVDVEVRVVPTQFDAPWYRDVVRKARFGSKQAVAMAFKRLVDEMANDSARNQLIGGIAAEHVAVGQLVVALSHRREHCGVLSAEFDRVTGGKGGVLLGGKDNADEYDRAKRGLADGSVRAAAATYQAFGTGMDVPALEVGIFATPVANSKMGQMQFDQFRGRFARASAGKDHGVVYYVWDALIYGKKPLKNLAKWCRNVTVRHHGQWIPVRDYLKRRDVGDADARRDQETDGTDEVFIAPRAGVDTNRSTGQLRSRAEVRRPR